MSKKSQASSSREIFLSFVRSMLPDWMLSLQPNVGTAQCLSLLLAVLLQSHVEIRFSDHREVTDVFLPLTVDSWMSPSAFRHSLDSSLVIHIAPGISSSSRIEDSFFPISTLQEYIWRRPPLYGTNCVSGLETVSWQVHASNTFLHLVHTIWAIIFICPNRYVTVGALPNSRHFRTIHDLKTNEAD